MRTLIISDIHGNHVALEAVLAAARPFDNVICLGDLVGYGPDPNECVETVRHLDSLVCLAGNHDLGATGRIDTSVFSSGAASALAWTSHELVSGSRDFLNNLASTAQLDGMFLAHASPRDPVWEYLEYPRQAVDNFQLFDDSVCFVGHTHVPRIFEKSAADGSRGNAREVSAVGSLDLRDGTRRIINPGSVGQPRDGNPLASYGILDTETGTYSLQRVEYEIAETQRRILRVGLPPSLASRLAHGM